MTTFNYRAFRCDGEPGLTLQVTDRMLPAQTHLLPVMAAIDRRLRSGDQSWRLHLLVEETEPFDVEFTTVAHELAVARFRRGDLDAILVLVPESVLKITMADMTAIQHGLSKMGTDDAVSGMFDWLTGIPAPLAGMLHIHGSAANGLDMLAMCMAERFFRTGCS